MIQILALKWDGASVLNASGLAWSFLAGMVTFLPRQLIGCAVMLSTDGLPKYMQCFWVVG